TTTNPKYFGNQKIVTANNFNMDNDPKHTSRITQSFFNENVPELIMDWPSK
ncbi:2933_t:CDS:1, partial [Entrophospora sp. SA101]